MCHVTSNIVMGQGSLLNNTPCCNETSYCLCHYLISRARKTVSISRQ